MIDVGIFDDANYGPAADNLPVAQVAEWLELGVQDGQPRPFFTDTVEQYAGRSARSTHSWEQIAQAFLGVGALNSTTFKHVMLQEAEYLQARVMHKIENNSYPQNRDQWRSYKAMVGAPTDPLMFTTQMLASISVKWRT
jgi:hypothetical protein